MYNYIYLCTNKAKNMTKIMKNWAVIDDVDHIQFSSLGFLSISLTVGASRLMETQMDLSRLLFGVIFSLEYVENVRG